MKKLFPAFLLLLAQSSFGQFAIGHRTITYNDPDRTNRAIECEIYYPGISAGNNVAVESGEFPVIVFGHGFTMQPTAYPNWNDEFVPDGYIVVLPATETGFSPSHQEFGLDLRFIATQMQAEGQNNASPFYQHVSDKTALMGHSMGGGAAFLAASGFSGVDCIVGLAPAETNPSAVAAGANVSAPAMILSGASDGVTPPADHHIPIYDGLASSCKYFVSIANGSHCRFASNPGLCTFGEIIPGSLSAADQQAVSYAVCHPWFDYFLKDDCDAWDDYQTALSTETDLGTINSDCDNTPPFISDNGVTLESDNQVNYQWYLNGNELPGETQQNHVYTQSGTYQVGTEIIGNCPTLSNEIIVQITGIIEREIGLKTNSNGTQIRSRDQLNNVTLEWYDASGRMLSSGRLASVQSNQNVTIHRPIFNGVQLLRLRSDETVKTWKLF